MNNTKPGKGCFLQIGSIEIICHLIDNSLGHTRKLLPDHRLVKQTGRLVLLLRLSGGEHHRLVFASGLNSHRLLVRQARMLVGVEVVEVVGLLAESDASVASAELLHQEGVVLLHDLPDQLSWNGSHGT